MAENGVQFEESNQDLEIRMERLVGRSREQRTTRAKDKGEEGHLPTPPPDPWISSNTLPGVSNQSEVKRPRSLEEEEIIAYLSDLGASGFEGQNSECPSRNSATSTMAVANIYSEEAFEHLDRLYSLTEQILELRTRSSKFFKRVRDLERLKVLKNADRRIEEAFARDNDLLGNYWDEDTGFAESLLEAMLSNCREPQLPRRNLRSPYSRQRSRSLALSEQSLPRLPSPASRSEAEKRVPRNNGSCSAPKVSKWTRVKAAFKWERACTNDAVDMIEMNPTTPTTPTTKYLRIPEVSSGNWSGSTLSPSTSEVSGPSTPLGRISSASSSNEGSYDGPRKNSPNLLDRQCPKTREEGKNESPNRRSRSLDGDMTVADAERTVEVTHGKPMIRITSDSNPMIRSSSIPEKKEVGPIGKRATPTLTITIPSNEEEIRSVSSPESTSPLPFAVQNSGGNSPQYPRSRQESSREFKRQRSTMEEPVTPAPKMQRQDSKWNKVRRAFLTNAAFSVPPSPVRIVSGQPFLQDGPGIPKAHSCSGSVEDLEKSNTITNNQSGTRKDYQALREKLGAEFHRKLVEWERLKNTPARNSARNTRESFSLGGSALSTRDVLLPAEERLAPEFKKKLQDWKRAKKGRRGSATLEQQRVSRRRLTDWQLWRSPLKPDTRGQDSPGGNFINDGKHHLCEDFIRRMEIWRRMNEPSTRNTDSGTSNVSRKLAAASGIDESEFIALEKLLPMFGEKLATERRDSDARQSEECFDDETRLVDGTQNVSNNEILIRTSMGSYRFEGISREFTRKLYDWEKYRGISPRSSTFRLLGPGYAPFTGTPDIDNPESIATATKVADDEKVLGVLKKSKSVGSIVENAMRSESFIRRSTSLQSLDRLGNKLQDSTRTDASPAPIDSRGAVDVSDDAIMDDSEPEAMIVDIEDVIEETASPLERVQPHQTPVYSVAASETTSIAVPLGTVTSSHEPSPVFLVEIEESSNPWDSRHWNQRKTFSSDDSPSPEPFKIRKFRKSPDSVGKAEMRSKDFIEESLDWKLDSLSLDKVSLKSDISTESYDTCRDKIVDLVQQDNFIDLKRDEIPALPSDGENRDGRITLNPERDLFGVVKISQFPVIPVAAEETKKSMDLSCEKKDDSGYKDREQDQDGCEKQEQGSVESKEKSEDLHQQEHPLFVTSDSSVERKEPIPVEEFTLKPSFANLTYSKYDDVSPTKYEANGISNHDYQNHQPSISKLNSEFESKQNYCLKITEQSSNEKANCGLYEKEEEDRNKLEKLKGEEETYRNYEPVATTFTQPYNRGPTIQTTPLTITSCEGQRSFERIFITEKTLNKVVVPTISTSETIKSLSHSSESSENKNIIDSIGNRENSGSRDASIKKNGSPTRNVLVKTKRMIFSPFKRSEDRLRKGSDASDEDQTLRGKSKSKSRSTSPKIPRQDTLLRMPLSLPWPLRPSSKDREIKLTESSHRRDLDSGQTIKETISTESKKDSRRNTMTEIQRRSMKSEVKIVEGKNEVRRSQVHKEYHVDVSVQVTPSRRENWTPVGFGVTRSRGKDNHRETSLISEALSSDLIHKLNILSNVAARRDGRTNSVSIGSVIESHSSRVRRAKESFLSRRGGPLCHSLLDTRSSNPDITKTTKDHYRHASESRESESTAGDDTSEKSDEEVRTLISEDAVIREEQNLQNEHENSRSDLSTSSRPDLVKSASAGMINVDPDTFDRLAESNRGCESLPRTISKQQEPSGAFAKIVSKFKFSRLIRGKESEDARMSTISRLCRQSLLIDVAPDFGEHREHEKPSGSDL